MPDGLRTPRVTLLLGQDGWVEHVDNGIRYTFDVTKCMFSPGNITEKLRVASLPCSGEVLVDLYAGNGDGGGVGQDGLAESSGAGADGIQVDMKCHLQPGMKNTELLSCL